MRSKKPNYFWANVWLTNANKGKCVIAVKDNDHYVLLSNSSMMKNEPEWQPIQNRDGWYSRRVPKDADFLTIFK